MRGTASFVRWVRRAHMHVAQVAQHGFVFFAHAAREIRIIQMLVARRLRHVLQHAQSLPDRLLLVGGQLPPLREQVILDMPLLFRRQLSPLSLTIANLLLLLRRQTSEILIVLFFLRTQILIALRICRSVARIRWPVRIEIRPLPGLAARIRWAISTDHTHRFGLFVRRRSVRRGVVVRSIIARIVARIAWPSALCSAALWLRLPPLLPRRLLRFRL